MASAPTVIDRPVETPLAEPPIPLGAPAGATHAVPTPKFLASNGPFVSRSSVEDVALQAAKSYLADANDHDITVGPVILSRYGDYTSILGLGRSTEFADDREMYIVSVYGRFILKRFPSFPSGQVPPAVGYLNFEIDATTAQIAGMFTSTKTQDPAVQLALATLSQ